MIHICSSRKQKAEWQRMISGFGLKSNGGALLTDTTMDYPLDQDELLLMKEVHAKTISSDFDEQLDASEHFYGRNLRFSFTKKDVERLLEKPELNMYDMQIRTRVANIFYQQMNKYKYLFY